MSASPSTTTWSPAPLSAAASVALAILAFKGFTTITNSGDELADPKKNIGRAIVISLVACLVVYLAVCFAVASSLTPEELIESKNYALAQPAEPAIGGYRTPFTVVIAMIATASGLLASVFAVSRMLAMLTDMNLIPHRAEAYGAYGQNVSTSARVSIFAGDGLALSLVALRRGLRPTDIISIDTDVTGPGPRGYDGGSAVNCTG